MFLNAFFTRKYDILHQFNIDREMKFCFLVSTAYYAITKMRRYGSSSTKLLIYFFLN